MTLLTQTKNEVLKILKNKLNAFIENNWLIMVHIESVCMQMHHAFCPTTAIVNDDQILLSFQHFELSIQPANLRDMIIDTDGAEESFCLITDDMEVYLDFSQ